MRQTPHGILLVAFGVGTRQGAPALRQFEAKVRLAFPGTPVRWAFTARHEARRPVLAEDSASEAGPAVAEALALFTHEGVLRVAAQPLHLVPGAEHAALLDQVAQAQRTCPGLCVSVGRSLLADEESVTCVARAMRSFPPARPDTEEAAIWVGHGTRHAAQEHYSKLAELLRSEEPPVFFGTLNGGGSVGALLPDLLRLGFRKARLIPFFALPGRHAAYDMAGRKAASWRAELEKAGIACLSHARGMVEHDLFAQMWIERLREALAALPHDR